MKPFCCCKKSCSCCNRRLKRLESYTNASKTFDAELDMQRLLNAVRLTEFMSMLSLKRYQRQLVNHFRKYQIEEIAPKLDKNVA